jgi:4'-phosphopantetheinyl transferase
MNNWTDKFPGGLFECDHVHIWRASLDYSKSKLNLLIGSLSKDETERADRFYFEKDRTQFIVRRGILKQIISKYLEIDPKNLLFEYNRFGKPFLNSNSPKHDFRFNMSHSKNMALYCISHQKDVGIDIEYIQKDIEFLQIIDRFFSHNEKKFIQKINIDKRKEAFFKIWTRKEAILKALGKGISFPLEKVDVSFNKDNFITRINDNDYGQCTESSWYVKDLLPTEDYVASIAIEGSNPGLILSHFTF